MTDEMLMKLMCSANATGERVKKRLRIRTAGFATKSGLKISKCADHVTSIIHETRETFYRDYFDPLYQISKERSTKSKMIPEKLLISLCSIAVVLGCSSLIEPDNQDNQSSEDVCEFCEK